VRVLGKKPEHTHIVIDLVDEEDWGYAGVLPTEWLKQQKKQAWSTGTMGTARDQISNIQSRLNAGRRRLES
jgi:hypothetical protein